LNSCSTNSIVSPLSATSRGSHTDRIKCKIDSTQKSKADVIRLLNQVITQTATLAAARGSAQGRAAEPRRRSHSDFSFSTSPAGSAT
jgi:hypothetical protein